MDDLDNLNIVSFDVVPPPAEIRGELPLSASASATVVAGRRAVQAILDRQDPRLFAVVGPCSIHDMSAALDYAGRLRALADEVADCMLLVMRIYFEKPRTTVGWKGLINDPLLDGSFCLGEGLRRARKLLLEVADMGVPAGTEALDPIVPQYIADLLSWSAVGARTTESQTHREMASGMSMPVGFKNSTDGSLQAALNALEAVAAPHTFLGIDGNGQCAVFRTRGNAYGHLVLRGGTSHCNYDPASIAACEKQLAAAGLPVNVLVDCSHGNSAKDPRFQEPALRSCVEQILAGNCSIVGFMLESHLAWGRQEIAAPEHLAYGVSVTDACIDWMTTERVIRDAARRLRPVLPGRLRVCAGDAATGCS